MKRSPQLLLVLASWVWPGAAVSLELGSTYFQTVAGSETVANGVVTALAEDRRGLIWFGSTEGLSSFDGYRLRRFHPDPKDPDALGDDYVRALLGHSDGRLWIATQGAGLSVYDPERDRLQHHRADAADPDALADDGPIALAEGADGGVWIGFGAQGLDFWNPQRQRFEHHRHQPGASTTINHNTVRSLLVDSRGDLWVGTANGLNRRRLGSTDFESILSDPEQEDSLAGHYVYALFEDSVGQIWIGTQDHGAAVLDPRDLRLRRLPADEAGLGHPWVDGFVETDQAEIWATTFGAGIAVLDRSSGALKRHIRNDPAIPGSLGLDRVVAPLRDRSGLIWIGTWGGGLQWHNPHHAAAFRVLRHSPTQPQGLSGNAVLSVMAAPDGRWWVGTDGNGIDVIDPQRGLVAGHRPDPARPGALGDGTVRAMAIGTDGSYWIGTQQAGLFRWTESNPQFREVALGGRDQRVRRLHVGADGTVWVGTQRGLARLDPGTEQVDFLRLEDGTRFSDPVWSLAESADGTLWLSTPNALFRCLSGTRRLQPAPESSSAAALRAVMDLQVDAQGQMWAVGPNGVFHWDGGTRPDWPRVHRWRPDRERSQPSFGRQLLLDRSGYLWTPGFRIDPRSGEAISFGREDGADIGNVELGAAAATVDGLLLFGGSRGLLIIDPEQFRPWPYQPPLLVTSLDIDGAAQSLAALQGDLVLGAEQGRLSFEFAALDYSAPQQVQYSYRLHGLEQRWTTVDAGRRLASYNNLWPGNYRLLLRARSRHGQWTEPALVVPLQVLPAWWQTGWFAALAVLGLILMVRAGLLWRTARIERQAAQLRVLVARRTEEMSRAKQRAEQSLRELQIAQRQLVEAEKMASLGQLVAGVAHEINTPMGIAVTAASHLQEVAEQSGGKLLQGALTRSDLRRWHEVATEASGLILTSLSRASVLIASFKRVSVDQSSEQRRCFQLAQVLDEAARSLEPSFRRQGHTLLIDCPQDIELDTYPGALFQILANLVNNAITHGFSEGQAGQMRVQARRRGERLLLSFSDTGQGMSEEVAAHAFDPFFTTRRGSGGSGLGLHLVHNLTTQVLGGVIELQSRPGQGTEFVFDLPLKAPQTAADAPV